MTNAVTIPGKTTREKGDNIIKPIMPEIVGGLPANVSPERFQAAFMTAAAGEPKIFQCSPQSIRTALLKCAADGLVPDGRQAALVPFRVKDGPMICQYIPMVQGIISRARELGDIEGINAQPIYEKDHFIWHQGDDEKIDHTPATLGKPRGEIIGAYAIFKVAGRIVHREVMDKDAIDKARAVSMAKNSPAWNNWYSEMARKTVIRRGAKYVPMSDKLRTLIERDDEFVDFSQPTSAVNTEVREQLAAAGAKAPPILDHVEAELAAAEKQKIRETVNREGDEDDFPGDKENWGE